MSVLDLLPFVGGAVVHHECRDCGTNLQRERPACPACGGDVVTHQIKAG